MLERILNVICKASIKSKCFHVLGALTFSIRTKTGEDRQSNGNYCDNIQMYALYLCAMF